MTRDIAPMTRVDLGGVSFGDPDMTLEEKESIAKNLLKGAVAIGSVGVLAMVDRLAEDSRLPIANASSVGTTRICRNASREWLLKPQIWRLVVYRLLCRYWHEVWWLHRARRRL